MLRCYLEDRLYFLVFLYPCLILLVRSMPCYLFSRKVNLREMKILQREEQKQGMLLMAKIRRQWDAQEQRFEQELLVIIKKKDRKVTSVE